MSGKFFLSIGHRPDCDKMLTLLKEYTHDAGEESEPLANPN